MLCWAANLVEAYNKEVRVGFKDRYGAPLRTKSSSYKMNNMKRTHIKRKSVTKCQNSKK